MRKVRINRAKWRSGYSGNSASGKGETCLLNDLGYMCCLGFTVHQLAKCSKLKMLNVQEPDGLPFQITPLTTGADNSPTKFSIECVNINDSVRMTRKKREHKLKRKFKEENLELEFYGEYEDWSG